MNLVKEVKSLRNIVFMNFYDFINYKGDFFGSIKDWKKRG